MRGGHGDRRDPGGVGRGRVEHGAVLEDDDAVGVVLRRHPTRAAAAAELGVEGRAEPHADVTAWTENRTRRWHSVLSLL